MKALAKFLIERLKEPSTAAGIAALLGAYHISADQSAAVLAALIGGLGLLAVFLPE